MNAQDPLLRVLQATAQGPPLREPLAPPPTVRQRAAAAEPEPLSPPPHAEEAASPGTVTEVLQFKDIVLSAGEGNDKIRIVEIRKVDSVGGEEQYRLVSYYSGCIEFDVTLAKPAVSLARYRLEVEAPFDFIGEVRDMSQDNPVEFVRWIKKLLQQYGSELCLILYDFTADYDMAWELVHVKLRQEDGIPILRDLTAANAVEAPIGALAQIVRWIPGIHSYDTELQLLVKDTAARPGSLAAYLDAHSLPGAQHETSAFAGFVNDLYDTPAGLRSALQESAEQKRLGDVGLIYFGCHGAVFNSDEDGEYIFGSRPGAATPITIFSLGNLEAQDQFETRPVVMINACHSGCVFKRRGRYYGLPRVLLNRIARDFIGTVGEVDDDVAARVGATLLLELRYLQSVRLAAVMRKMREVAFRQMHTHKYDDRAGYEFLCAFMYVHYGSPLSRLSLRTRPAPGETTGLETGQDPYRQSGA